MRKISGDGKRFLLRFDPGEEVIAGLQAWCTVEGIGAASMSGIGACREVVLSYFDRASKSYHDQKIVAELEICSLAGNVALREGVPFVHAHGTFASRDFGVRGGHVKAVVVSATCEVALDRFFGSVRRVDDAATGLALLSD